MDQPPSHSPGNTGRHLLTMDLDWAPDWMIDACAARLVELGVRATIFVTHDSPAVRRLMERPEFFELGLHPNFGPNSSQGATPEEVLAHLRGLLPRAQSMRTHGLIQSTNLMVMAARDFGVRYDSSIFLGDTPHIAPHLFEYEGAILLRVPVCWEDDIALCQRRPAWRLEAPVFHSPGLKVFDFHPVHVCLNTNSLEQYRRLCRLRPLRQWSEDFVEEHRRSGPGPRGLFEELTTFLRGGGGWISQLPWPARAGEED